MNAKDYNDYEKNYYVDENDVYDQNDYDTNMILYISED